MSNELKIEITPKERQLKVGWEMKINPIDLTFTYDFRSPVEIFLDDELRGIPLEEIKLALKVKYPENFQ